VKTVLAAQRRPSHCMLKGFMTYKIRVWDLPTRLFHWVLALCIVAQFVTGNLGGDAMLWHMRAGYLVLSLLLFRLIWGVVGGHWSRFASFIRGPSTVLAYLRGRGPMEHSVGHNPLGALSVVAMLSMLLLQASSGLLSDDEIAASGPLAQHVSNAVVSLATHYHKTIGKFTLIALVLVHIAAIGYYRTMKRQNLVTAMLDGDKEFARSVKPSRDDGKSRALAALLFAVCATLVALGVKLVS
jgi:cytochrome b